MSANGVGGVDSLTGTFTMADNSGFVRLFVDNVNASSAINAFQIRAGFRTIASWSALVTNRERALILRS